MTTANVGDKVHYWSKRTPQQMHHHIQTLCFRCVVREVSPDGKWARVERLNGAITVPVQTVAVSRLREGWNNWLDPEGRPITELPENRP